LKRIDFRRVFVIAAVASLLLCYVLLWLRMITTPVDQTGPDFVAFYAAGRIAQSDGAARVYDLALQQHYEEEVVGFQVAAEHISPFLHPPYIVPLARLLTLDNFILSFVLWDMVMLAFFVLGAVPLFYLLRDELPPRQRLVLLAGILLFFPAYASLMIGQDSAIVSLGVCLWLFGLLTKKDWLAGLGLAAMTLRPHLVLPLALPFIFKRRGVWWWFLLGAAALAVVSLAYVGMDGVIGFLRVLLISGQGENYHTGENHMFNTIGVLWRAFPALPTAWVHGIGWGVYLAAIIGLCVLWVKSPGLDERHLSLGVILALFTSPHTHVQDLVLLIVPIACLMLVLLRKKYLSPRDAAILPLAASLLLLFSFFADFLKYGVYYLLIIFLPLAVWLPEKLFHLPKINS
jgi:hypothetical protein